MPEIARMILVVIGAFLIVGSVGIFVADWPLNLYVTILGLGLRSMV